MAENQLILEASKLLQELEEKAWNRIKATLHSESNIINFSGFVMSYQDPQLPTTNSIELAAKWAIVIDINGQTFNVEEECTYPLGTLRQEVGKKIWKSIHDTISSKLVELVMPKIQHLVQPQ